MKNSGMIDVTPRRQKTDGKVPDHRWRGPRLALGRRTYPLNKGAGVLA